jgi:predicted lipid-binding transport protein (Tim44 family)
VLKFCFFKGTIMKLMSMLLVACMAFASVNADAARRFGGGKSVGQQSSNVTHREATGGGAAAPVQNAGAVRPAAPMPAAPAVAPKRPWGAMLGGLAAGLGLAWLASSLGLGAAFGQIIMFALLALTVMMVVGYFMRRRNAANAGGMQRGGLALQGAGGGGIPPASVAMPRSYSADHVGNDASARPWEHSSASQTGNTGASALRGSQNWGVPADFDSVGFLTAAKANYISLQAAWDRSDIPALRVMMTDTMLDEIKAQLAEREASGTAPQNPLNHTEVIVLEAQLLGIEETGDHYMASVEFSGMIREDVSAGPSAFREVWNMTKVKNGGGWLVAGVQALGQAV